MRGRVRVSGRRGGDGMAIDLIHANLHISKEILGLIRARKIISKMISQV